MATADQIFPSKPEPEKRKIGERFFERVKQNHKDRVAEAPGQFWAMWREGLKDVRGTMHQVFFNQPEHAPEQGTPQNPTSQMVTDQLGYEAVLASYANRAQASRDHDKGIER